MEVVREYLLQLKDKNINDFESMIEWKKNMAAFSNVGSNNNPTCHF
jgi:hypothetical protein